jgi:hypothetical protein
MYWLGLMTTSARLPLQAVDFQVVVLAQVLLVARL